MSYIIPLKSDWKKEINTVIFFIKMSMNMVSNNSIDKTTQKSQLVSCFQYQIVLEHIAILDRQMPKPLFNNFEDNLFYLVKLVTLPITICIFFGEHLNSTDLEFDTCRTYKYYYIIGKRTVFGGILNILLAEINRWKLISIHPTC